MKRLFELNVKCDRSTAWHILHRKRLTNFSYIRCKKLYRIRTLGKSRSALIPQNCIANPAAESWAHRHVKYLQGIGERKKALFNASASPSALVCATTTERKSRVRAFFDLSSSFIYARKREEARFAGSLRAGAKLVCRTVFLLVLALSPSFMLDFFSKSSSLIVIDLIDGLTLCR